MPPTGWAMIAVPPAFPVLDVLLVYDAKEFFAVQITAAQEPFRAHLTPETCSATSEDRLVSLAQAVWDQTGKPGPVPSLQYVMVAPMCTALCVPPAGHTSAFWLHAAGVPAQALAPVKGGCCQCKSGKCRGCRCFKRGEPCVGCASGKCENC